MRGHVGLKEQELDTDAGVYSGDGKTSCVVSDQLSHCERM